MTAQTRIKKIFAATHETTVASLSYRSVLVLILAHLAIGMIIRESSAAATIHALGVAAAAVYVLANARSLDRFLIVTAYAMGSSVLWRVGKAGVLWFLPEYLTLLIVVAGIWKLNTSGRGVNGMIMFMLLLLPSTFLTIILEPIGVARDMIAFNLLPLLVFSVLITTLSRMPVHVETLRQFLFYSVLPVLSLWVLSAFNVFIVGTHYGASSNAEAAGGFAPNQVSNAFSFGAVALTILLVLPGSNRRFAVPFIVAALLLVVQSVMTFSRGGLYNVLVFLVFFIPFFLQQRGQRLRFFLLMAVLVFISFSYIAPALDDYTEGQLERRYEKEGTSSRDILILQDLDMFIENPLLGVGPGRGRAHRFYSTRGTAQAHTEFSRLLAEHGIFGAAAMLMLLFTFYGVFRRASTKWQKSIIAGSVGWILVMLMHSATRIPMFILLGAVATMTAYLHTEEGEQAASAPSVSTEKGYPAGRPIGSAAQARAGGIRN